VDLASIDEDIPEMDELISRLKAIEGHELIQVLRKYKLDELLEGN